MTMQELLKAQGLTDEQIVTITDAMKQNKIFTVGEENLDIRYSKLKADHDNLIAQHGESTKLIEQFKAGAKDNEALQGKITAYESQIGELQTQLKQTQLDAAVQVALIGAKATDVEYMAFRLKEKGELELDDKGHIKGIDDRLASLKTQYPTFFEGSNGQRGVEPQPLPDRNNNNNGNVVTKEQFEKMGYKSRVELKESNPELYNQLMKG